jgi:hypothetical protein
MKNYKLEFRYILQKKLCHSKTTITFAYNVGLKSFLYEKVSERKVTYEFNVLTFRQFLDSSNSKGKIYFFALLVS